MKKLLIVLVSVFFIVSCSGKKETKNTSGGKYTILKTEESEGYKTISILVKNEISEENLRKLMKEAAIQNLGNSKGIHVNAFGDERFLKLAGNTHGLYTYSKYDKISNTSSNYFLSKRSKPSEKVVNITIDYFKLYERDWKKEIKLQTNEEKLKLYDEHLEELSKKYNMSKDEIVEKMDEFNKYQHEDVVPDEE